MFAAVVFALATSAAIAAPIAERAVPSGWATGYLEDYNAYHTRYLALDCHDKHNTSFFEDCCHPLLATQSLSDRPAYCRPNSTDFASASAYAATATVSAAADAASAYVSAAAEDTSAASSAVADAQVQVAQASTSTQAPTSTEAAQPAAQTTQAASSGDVMTGGYATYFYQGGNAGACGVVHSDSDKVIAIDSNGWWQNYNSGGPSDLCGKWINIVNTNNGKSVTAQVADVCPTCVSDNSLDLSVGAFTAIASESDGQVPITWTWA